MPKRGVSLFGFCILAVLLLGCANVRPGCSVKVVAHNASVTVEGIFAGQACEALLRDPQTVLGPVPEPLNDPANWFEPTEAPREPQMCRYTVSGQTFTVRDEGVFKILGQYLCQALKQKATGATL